MTPCSDADIRRGALLIRARPGDSADARPIEPCENVDASPDLLLLGGADAGTAFVGAEHTVRVKVTNAGPRPIEEIDVEAWVCDRSAGTPPLGRLDSPGRMTGVFPGPLESGASALVNCSPKWTPSAAGLPLGDRLCLAANVSAATPPDGAELTEGSVLKICCDTHHAQRNVTLRRRATDVITTIAGTGVHGFSGDGGPATAAQLSAPVRVAVTPAGDILIAEKASRVRKGSRDGKISTVAGGGSHPALGDGPKATDVVMDRPVAVAVTADGGFLISEEGANRIRKVLPNGTITTVAGTGVGGFSGDGGPATAAQMLMPAGVASTPDGGFIFADLANSRIRKVSADGTIMSVAGGGTLPLDGMPAVKTALAFPQGVAMMPDGGFLIADMQNHRVRRVLPDGTITNVAGAPAGPLGDGGPAVAAQLSLALDVAVAP